MSEYVYATNGTPVSNADGEISLPREQIIRCRDCKEYRKSDCTCHSWQWHYWGCALEVDPNGFCAWGEREVEQR